MAKSLTFKFDSTVAGQNRANALLTALSGKPFTGCEPVNFVDGRGSKHVYAVLVNLDPVVYKHIVPANWLSYPAKTMAEALKIAGVKRKDIQNVREKSLVVLNTEVRILKDEVIVRQWRRKIGSSNPKNNWLKVI